MINYLYNNNNNNNINNNNNNDKTHKLRISIYDEGTI